MVTFRTILPKVTWPGVQLPTWCSFHTVRLCSACLQCSSDLMCSGRAGGRCVSLGCCTAVINVTFRAWPHHWGPGNGLLLRGGSARFYFMAQSRATYPRLEFKLRPRILAPTRSPGWDIQISFPSSVFWEKGREGSHTTPRWEPKAREIIWGFFCIWDHFPQPGLWICRVCLPLCRINYFLGQWIWRFIYKVALNLQLQTQSSQQSAIHVPSLQSGKVSRSNNPAQG